MSRSKYRAQKCEYRGELYDSRAEAAYAKYLDEAESRGELYVICRRPRYRLGCPENVYEGDWVIQENRWVYVVDTKGVETAKFRKDKQLWKVYGRFPLKVIRLKLVYQSEGLPRITGQEVEVIHGGRDRRVYGPLAPEWLRTKP